MTGYVGFKNGIMTDRQDRVIIFPSHEDAKAAGAIHVQQIIVQPKSKEHKCTLLRK